MSDFDLEWGVRVSGVDDALRNVGRVAQANEQTATRTTAAAQNSSRSIAQLGQTVQSVGQRFTALSGILGSESDAGRTLGRMGQLAAVGGSLGSIFGPMGGAVGAAAGALFGLGEALTPVVPALRDVTTEARQSTEAAIAMGDAFVGAGDRMREFVQGVSTASRSRGLEDVNAQITEVADRIEYLTTRGSALERLDLPGLRDRLIGLTAESTATREGLDTEDGEVSRFRRRASASGGDADTFRSDGGAAMRALMERPGDAEWSMLESEIGAEGGGDPIAYARGLLEAEAELLTEKRRMEDEAHRERIAHMRELADTSREASATFQDSWRGSTSDVIEAFREANRALKTSGGQMLSTGELLRVGMTSVGNQIADTIGGTMVSAFEQALGAWLDGSKSFVEAAEDMVKGVLKALVVESIVQAVTETARGIADIASYRYDSGALHFAAAAAWAAVGGVAGAVGAGIGAFGGGGKDAGSASAQTVTPTDASSQQAAQQPMVINVYPGGFLTQRDVQAGIVDALNDAAREGRRVDPSLIGG